MLRKTCSRCHQQYSEEELFYLGFEDDKGKAVYVCEGCLFSFEQDFFFNQFRFLLPARTCASV